MRTKITLILLLLNVALFFYIYKTRNDDPSQKDPVVLGPETSNIHRIVITKAGSDTPVRIERGTDIAWTLTEPLRWPANEFAVNRIVSELQQLRPYSSFDVEMTEKSGRTLAEYGLDKPPLTLTYTPATTTPNTTPKEVVLKIGGPTAGGNRIYILSPDGKTIHVVNRSLAESLALRIEELRSDTIFTIPVFEVRTFKLQPQKPETGAPPNPTSIDNDNNNSRWVFKSPFKSNDVRANKAATVIAINKLHTLRIKEFVDPKTIDNTRTGLATPELQITLIGNNRRETLLLGTRTETNPTTPTPATDSTPAIEYYARMEEKNQGRTDEQTPIFKIAIPVDLKKTLDNAQEALRDPHVLDFDPAHVTTLTLSAPNSPQVTLQRLESATPGADSLWQVVRNNGNSAPLTHPADRERVEKLLAALARLSAVNFTNDAPTASELEDYGFNRPIREISLTLARPQPNTASTVTTLQLGAKSETDPVVFAKLTSQPYIYRVDPAILNNTPTAALAYRARLVRDLPAGAQITTLKLIDLANNTPLLDVAIPLPAATESSDPTLTPQRRTAIESLATQLRTLRAKNLLREEFPATLAIAGEERPWRYRLDTTIALFGGTGAQTSSTSLYFSERVGGTTQYSGSPDLLLTFEADQPLIDALFTLIYGSKDPGSIPEPSPAPKTP